MSFSRILTFVLGLLVTGACAAEGGTCLATNPDTWPPVSKPYVLIIADTSGSMTGTVGSSDSCGYGTDRRAHQRCALNRIMKAYAGQVEFGLMSFATQQTACSGACFTNCTYTDYPNNATAAGCGPESSEAATSPNRRGGVLRVPIRADNVTPPAPDSFTNLNAWSDNSCTSNIELFASGNGPLNGALRDAYRYLSNQWTAQDNSVIIESPLNASNGVERACRKLRVILMTDAGDNCDLAADATDAAADLLSGFTRGGVSFSVRTHVVALAGGSVELDNIAAAGGTMASVSATNEAQIFDGLNTIVLGLLTPESADNADNDCNGCSDEGFPHFANTNPVCCAWASIAQRNSCMTTFQASISVGSPQGNRSLLPCTDAVAATQPTTWLTFDPGETCDGSDNNGNGQTDEGMLKCGNPAHCPATEVCDAEDNDCDGQTDEGGVCGPFCSPTPEICDGCDNDCDGVADDGVAAASCGQPSPANCAGTLVCRPSQVVGVPGACTAGGGFAACTNNPLPETCDGLDNSCNGQIDDGLGPVGCEPPSTPSGLTYGGNSQCRRGQQFCGQSLCHSFVGPTPEVSDGIDNDCDGLTDDGIDAMFRNSFE